MPGALCSKSVRATLAGAIALAGNSAGDAWSQTLPLPPGNVVTGPVFKPPFLCAPSSVPSITNGADANAYILPSPSCVATPSFVPTAPAAMVVTTTPTQYVRFYCPDPQCSPVSVPNRPFMADPSTVRGLTPAQIQDVLALPGLPNMITIVTVPAASCVLVGKGAPAFGGTGGPAQEWAAGIPSAPNCQGLQYLPLSDYINQQAIGAYALLYGPRAGSGNASAVAAALDQGPYPAPFTDMDGVYKSFDLLNFGDPAQLRAALVQLDGEIYADHPSIAIDAGQMFLGAVRAQMRADDQTAGQVRAWLSIIGGVSILSGDGDSHNVNSAIGGLAGGIERRFDTSLVAGLAIGWAGGSFSTSGISGSGTTSTFAIAPYVRYAPGSWYVEGTIGYGYSSADVNRDMYFVNRDLFSSGTMRTTIGRPGSHAFLSQVETGYRATLDARTSVTPFVAMQAIVIRQSSFTESGGGAVDLHVSGHTTDLTIGVVGAEVAHAIPAGTVAAPLRLSGRLGWAHDFGDTQRTATAFLDGTPSAAPFTVNGAPAVGDRVLFGVGMTQSLPSFDLFVRYEGTAGNGSIQQAAIAGARFAF